MQHQQNRGGVVFLLNEELEEPTSLVPYLSFLLDAPEDCDITAILNDLQDQFQPWESSLVPSFGYVNHPVWLKLSIRSSLPLTTSTVLEIVNGDLDYVDIYIVKTDLETRSRKISSAEIGSIVRQEEKNGFRRLARKSIEFEPNQQAEIFLRIKTHSSMWLPVQILAKNGSSTFQFRRFLLDQLVFWFAAFTSFLSLILALILRYQLFLYNSLFAFCYFFYYITSNGYAKNFIHMPYEEFPVRLLIITSIFSVFAILSFTHRYYQSSLSQRSAIRKIARGATVLSLAVLPVCLMLPHISALYVVHGIEILSIFWITLVILFCTQRRFGWSQCYFIGAWACFATTSLMIHLTRPGLIPAFVQPNFLEMVTVIPIVSLLFTATSERMKEVQETERKLVHAMEAESKARLSALRYQINPHFLFNTLTSIDALSRVDPQKIPKLVERLADFLRPRLVTGDSNLISLSSELTAIQAYLEIEQMRFGNDLKLNWEIPNEMLNQKVPDGILQPLVENAIKHRPKYQREIEIQILAKIENRQLQLFISNRGSLKSSDLQAHDARSGIGLDNVRQRLAAHFGEAATVTLVQEGERVVCILSLPTTDEEVSRVEKMQAFSPEQSLLGTNSTRSKVARAVS